MSVEPSPLVVDIRFDISGEIGTLRGNFEGRAVINLQEEAAGYDLSGVKYALAWNPQPGLFARMPDLEILFSLGAGVDHILGVEGVPDVPIIRFVDPGLTNQMSEWICLQCLMHLRAQRVYDARQRACNWEKTVHPAASSVRIGIMGLGILGLDAATKLKLLGFDVAGWSRTKKAIEGIETYDAGQLDGFLARTDILVGLLPLTAETTGLGLFNRSLFEKLPAQTPIGGPVFINAGRGKSQVETDIIASLEDGTLGGVSLDVFETEPLPADSPLWGFENAVLTPHAAADSDSASLARHILRQITRHEAGQSLEHQVDRARGY